MEQINIWGLSFRPEGEIFLCFWESLSLKQKGEELNNAQRQTANRS
jgi:hypothetical protein